MAEIIYSRGLDTQNLRVNFGGECEVIQPLGEVLNHFGVNEAMRIPVLDYPDNAKPGEVLTHFNLPVSFNRTGFVVVMPKIIEHGYFCPPDTEKLPLLSFENVWRARVVNFLPHIGYEEITSDLFTSTIGGVKDSLSLMTLITNRYQRTLPTASTEEILSQGLSVTRLQLEELVSW